MFATCIKFDRLLTAIVMVLLVANSSPRPSLTPSIILTTVEEVQDLFVELNR